MANNSKNNYKWLDFFNLRKLGNGYILTVTFLLGIIGGIFGMWGYSYSITGISKTLFYFSIMLAAASFMAGFFAGFLFGIPRKNSGNNSGNQQSAYFINSNLIEISDWLTKIIVGVGLVELEKIPGKLKLIGDMVTTETHSINPLTIYTDCLIIYFLMFGLYFGYNYTRLFLSAEYRKNDDELLKKDDAAGLTQEAINNKIN